MGQYAWNGEAWQRWAVEDVGSGYVRLPVMMRTGFLLDVLAALTITFYAAWYLPLVLR